MRYPGFATLYPGYVSLLLRHFLRLAALAGDADLVAVGEAVGRRYDNAIVRRYSRGQLDVATEVAGDGDDLELNPIIRIDRGDAKAALVEDQGAGGNVQRHLVALQAELHIGVSARHQLAMRVVE